MVRETRHLWVGNLPDNIREDRIREHFKRYGRVQNVKLLGRTESAGAGASVGAVSGVCATVAFMDIKSASKAHNTEHVLDERTLTTEYYEPAAIPPAGAPSAGSSPAGSGYSGSSSSVSSAPAPALAPAPQSAPAPAPAPAPASVSRYHLSGGEEGTGTTCAIAATAAAPANWRGTNDSATDYPRRGNTPAAYGRYQRSGGGTPYATPPPNADRTTPQNRYYGSAGGAGTGGESTPSTPGGGTESGRARRRSGSGSSRSDSSSAEPSDASRASTPAGAAPPAARTPTHHQWASTASGRPLAICVRNLPTRSTDSSLKDGLYHEYKKHGKVVWVKVVGQNADRYAVVRFKKPSDVEKALEVSQDKLFFGCKISVGPHQSCDEDADSAKPYETDIDEYHPKATRTLFIGNLEKDVTQQQLRDKFKHFGRIIEIDIKKGSGGGAGYAFCQYASISSVVDAIRAMDGEHVGGSRVKLGFGKPVATTCVWIDGLNVDLGDKQQVMGSVVRYCHNVNAIIDRTAGTALMHFEQAAMAGAAVRELRRLAALASASDPERPRLSVDYASRECQEAFYEQLEKHGGPAAIMACERLTGEIVPRYIPSSTRHEPLRHEGGTPRARSSSYGRGSSRASRYSAVEHYDSADYAADRRYRVYDELGSSPQTEEAPLEDKLQSVVVSPHRARRHRRDSSTEERKHSKERHRGVSVAGVRRSRSGSRGGVSVERHPGRRRHRRRCEGSGSRSHSRAGTPLRDEPDAPPSEPRRPPTARERPLVPMSLPLPKFAAQLLRAAAPAPRATPAPAPAPDSPPRPPSTSSSSAGSAPHSPSLEERIRSLDEKYEKWSGSRALPAAPEPPDRVRLRHRLLEVDINEVKPSEVVRSLLAKRSVFDEDSERLEGAVRAPSPGGSPRARVVPFVPRALRYPFPAHHAHPASRTPPTPPTPHTPLTPQPLPILLSTLPLTSQPPLPMDIDADSTDRPADPRLNRPERTYQIERLGKFNESDYKLDTRTRLRTPSTDKSLDLNERRRSPRSERERLDLDRDPRRDIDKRRRNSLYSASHSESKSSFEAEEKEVKEAIERIDPDFQNRERNCVVTIDKCKIEENLDSGDDKLLPQATLTKNVEKLENHTISPTESSGEEGKDNTESDVTDSLLGQIDKRQEPFQLEQKLENESKISEEKSLKSDDVKHDLLKQIDSETSQSLNENKLKSESDDCKEILIQNHINKEILDLELHLGLNTINSLKQNKEISELTQELIKNHDKNGKERYNQHIILEAFHNTRLEKENIEFDKSSDKEKCVVEKRLTDSDKSADRSKNDRDKIRLCKERAEKDRHDTERDKSKNNRNERVPDKNEKEKKSKDDSSYEKSHPDKVEKYKPEKEIEKVHKSDKEIEKSKHHEEKSSRHDHYKKDKRKDNGEIDSSKIKKEDKYKHDRRKESSDSKREYKKDLDGVKIRKSSRDESSRDLCRKDSTDSSTSRASHDSTKLKDLEIKEEIKEELKPKLKYYNELFLKKELDKEFTKSVDTVKVDHAVKIKEEKEQLHPGMKSRLDNLEPSMKSKTETSEKQRHYSLDSPSVDCKRKERLNSSSSLPSHIGHKRRMSSQDSIDFLNEELKKSKNELKRPERRDSKDSRSADRHKTTKFNKGHFAKLIESKTKDDKKNQVKPPDDTFTELRDLDIKDQKKSKKSPKRDNDEKVNMNSGEQPEGLRNDLDFLATLELRSSEEDERQKALRKEMKEKKRIQQLQQIQELQMQQDAMQHAELMGKFKDEKKQRSDDKKKEAAREKRMSTDRKSRDDKNDTSKRKNRKHLQSTDTSDSDEPKKHSIFDIVDDGPTYISMYDKVKARSCKNMQKQEEEKRQEKIKAKFSQLKQSRAKREEKKRSSWDEDSDSDQDRTKPQKVDSSSDDEQIVIHSKRREKSHGSLDFDRSKTNDYFSIPSTEEDSRNKLSRKNSRTRIISDTSDDDTSKRSFSKSPSFNDIRKEFMSSFGSLHKIKDQDFKESDKIKKSSLLNLFGKSDSDDSKLKSSFESNDNKHSFMKSLSNDFSSESESMISNRNTCEVRKKHKKKQKKHRFSFSGDESKLDINDSLILDCDTKHKNQEKIRRHSNKKDKRKDKIRDSIDADDDKGKSRKDKRPQNSFDSNVEISCNSAKKEGGKMEDIFGPLSDESDRELGSQNNKPDAPIHDYDSTFSISSDQLNVTMNSEEVKLKEKEDKNRKRDKKRKEKRPFVKEDDNSLDVDAVSKAIEARLFADTVTDDDNRTKVESLYTKKIQGSDIKVEDKNMHIGTNKITDKHNERIKRDSKEKKKKKKKNREDRQNRKDHHHFNHNEKNDKIEHISDQDALELSSKSMLLDIPLPNDTQIITTNKLDSSNLVSESPSLPRLTDSPPIALRPCINTDTKNKDSDTPGRHSGDHNMEIDYLEKKGIEVNDIPMPLEMPPKSFENVVPDISEVPLPKDPIPIKSEQDKSELFVPSFGRDIAVSEDAVRSIPNIEKEVEKAIDKVDTQSSKVDKKLDEKPRAIISQEETEDAVAALLGESFGGKVDSFANCYEEVENNSTHQIEIECVTIESGNIPEEDAEEMRQAVQNLNACEMEMKPDTPVSDNDLLLIDTDTEEADETPQDAIDRLPVNIIATNQNLNVNTEQTKIELSGIITAKPKPPLQTVQIVNSESKEPNINLNESDGKLQLPKRDIVQQITSTATPVITSWTLTNKKLLEPRILNIQPNKSANLEVNANDKKPTHITANIVQIKGAQTQGMNSSLRPIITSNRVSAPYQVINHMIRPQIPNMQPPTIKIPEPHILYQKSQGVVISPRMSNDPRLQSPKASGQAEGMTSPRLSNINLALANTNNISPQNLNSVGIRSPNTLQQRSPGQVTVVRVQQPPLSPIQAMNLPHGGRTMVSPNRPNSVLVQTQGAPIHYNRLPVTPVLAPISKQMNVNNMMQQNKVIGVNSTLMHQQKIITGDYRKNDHRNMTDNLNENSKIIMSPTSLQHSTNPTVMAQNRLISMQNAIHAGNVNSLHLTNKVLVNNMNNLNDKREHQIQKSEQHNHIPFGSKPIIHVAGVNHSSASIIQNSTKPIMCTLQEANSLSRGQGSNVIHTINSQRLLTTAPLSNIRHIDANKGPPSVLSMATIRSPTVLTRLESSNTVAVTTNSLTNVVMTPLLLKTSSSSGTIRLSNNKNDVEHSESHLPKNTLNRLPLSQDKVDVKIDPIKTSPIVFDASDKHKYVKPEPSPVEPVNKSETDFEELLKDNTNEIKVTNDPDKKLEVNVGKTVTLFTTNSQYRERNQSTENCVKVEIDKEIDKEIEKSTRDPTVQPAPLPDGKDVVQTNLETNKLEVVMDSTVASSLILKPEPVEAVKENDPATIKDPLEDTNIDKICANEDQKLPVVNSNKHDSIFPVTISNHLQIDDNQMKHLDENDSWTAKDVNIESVIKKVDSLCNEIVELDNKDDKSVKSIAETTSEQTFDAETNFLLDELDSSRPMEIQTENESFTDISLAEQSSAEKTVSASKRGGRNVRGKKSEKNQDRVQTRQIVKPLRGGVSAKRGRGRARVDKKIKILVNQSPNNIPGDVYDFHEDSGDETSASPNKSEPRPRLILTIKSPLSGQCNAIATSTLSITPKDPLKNPEKTNKEDKPEDFASPSLNTRKSRRLQEKDVQRNTVDDVIEDVVKGANTQAKSAKDVNKKRPTRQIGPKTTQTDKGSGSDTRKSPRGVKRMRDRSLSDASVDSSDEKIAKRDDTPKEAKILKIEEPSIASKLERDPLQPAKTIQLVSANIPSVTPTPITKPPKKMISEISAKLASAFEAAAAAGPVRAAPHPAERAPAEPDKPPPCEPRDPELATAAPAAAEPTPVATAEARVSVSAVCTAEAHGGGEAALARRSDAVGVGGGMAPVGATEASDARVQSPALPHRPPAPHRLADRVTPLLVRGGDGEGASVAGVASVASVAAGAAAAGARAPRGYAGTASLPRGAHHPPHPPHAAHPAHPALPAHPAHPHAKHVAVIGPHNPHTHTGAASRVTITSVPTISPQGQIALGEGMYPHFSHQHYQMYQHHFRATQHESRATPSPYTRSLEAEGCEAPTPPLELRRPPSARMPRPAHSPSPADRLIMYAAGGGRSPPPAHVTSRLPGALPPAAAHGPPHASQVPREADSLQMLLRRYPVMWQGLLALKNDSAAVQMHFVGGNPGVAGDTLPRHTDGSTPPLRIAQRMRLEPAQLDQVHRKMKLENEHCILLALPCGRDHMDVLQQSTNLTAGFITYLQRKQAAGIVNVAPPGHHQAMFTVHIFPSCDFANENLNRIAPDLMHRVADIAHLLIVIATATV